MEISVIDDLAPALAADTKLRRGLPDVVRQIGNTPLLRLRRVAAHLPESVAIYAKAEHLNPSGSVKDRAARRMVLEGLRSGALEEGRTLIDATSGNTGIAYAMLGAAMGFPVAIALPANASPERKQILRAYGVDLILTDAMEGTDGAQQEVKRIVTADPDRYFYPDQYNNDANWRAHYDGTGAEIINQTRGRLTHFVAGLGTTGTFVGTARRLKAFHEGIQCYALQPDSPLHGMEGLKHLETAILPGIFDAGVVDRDLRCSTEDAHEMTRRLAREEGLLVGVSSGANVAAALRVAEELDEGVVVTILCDTGTRYLSDPFWQA
ncbi:MAG TPA: PLP-dependent cysteine synthase family protein [Rhodothermales bacterium]|nr:PLP-dependent cysteine synthase family protein [Rhodothermales bacterium]